MIGDSFSGIWALVLRKNCVSTLPLTFQEWDYHWNWTQSGALVRTYPVPFCRGKKHLIVHKTSGGPSHGNEFSQALTVFLSITHAAFCKIAGRMIWVAVECVFFGNSDTTRILPFLQCGQRVIWMPVSWNIISSIDWQASLLSSADSPKKVLIFLIFSALCRFDRNPKWRILMKPIGRLCSKNRRINSTVVMVQGMVFWVSRFLYVKVTIPSCIETIRWFDMATRWV